MIVKPWANIVLITIPALRYIRGTMLEPCKMPSGTHRSMSETRVLAVTAFRKVQS